MILLIILIIKFVDINFFESSIDFKIPKSTPNSDF